MESAIPEDYVQKGHPTIVIRQFSISCLHDNYILEIYAENIAQQKELLTHQFASILVSIICCGLETFYWAIQYYA